MTSREAPMGRVEYLDDPAAPMANALVPACGALAVDDDYLTGCYPHVD